MSIFRRRERAPYEDPEIWSRFLRQDRFDRACSLTLSSYRFVTWKKMPGMCWRCGFSEAAHELNGDTL